MLHGGDISTYFAATGSANTSQKCRRTATRMKAKSLFFSQICTWPILRFRKPPDGLRRFSDRLAPHWLRRRTKSMQAATTNGLKVKYIEDWGKGLDYREGMRKGQRFRGKRHRLCPSLFRHGLLQANTTKITRSNVASVLCFGQEEGRPGDRVAAAV